MTTLEFKMRITNKAIEQVKGKIKELGKVRDYYLINDEIVLMIKDDDFYHTGWRYTELVIDVEEFIKLVNLA